MAKFVKTGKGNFNDILTKLNNAIISGSMSSSLEDSNKTSFNGVTTVTKVYERYSFTGKNRLSLTLTLVGYLDNISLTLITSGGSQAVFFKINRFGENSFLNNVKDIANKLIK